MTMNPERRTPRQAIAVFAHVAHPLFAYSMPDWLPPVGIEEVRLALVRDHLASLVRVDGVTISVVMADRVGARKISPHIPAGIDSIVLDPVLPPVASLGWTVRRHLAAAFERVVIISGHALPIPARIAATGLSVLATADLVIGPTPAGGVYLIGARDERGAALMDAIDHASLSGIEASAQNAGLVARRLEPRRTLADFPTMELLREAAAGRDGEMTTLLGWLSRKNGSISTTG